MLESKGLNNRHLISRFSVITPATLVRGLLAGMLFATLVHGSLPAHVGNPTKISLALISALMGTIGGGAMWGNSIARLLHCSNLKRFTFAGALGYGITIILVVVGLSLLEVIIVEGGQGPDIPTHLVYRLLFVPAAFIVGGIGGVFIRIALKNYKLTTRLGISGGLICGLIFLLVITIMDALGWRVGASGSAAHATIVTVTPLGIISTAFAGGAVIGWELSRSTDAVQSRSDE